MAAIRWIVASLFFVIVIFYFIYSQNISIKMLSGRLFTKTYLTYSGNESRSTGTVTDMTNLHRLMSFSRRVIDRVHLLHNINGSVISSKENDNVVKSNQNKVILNSTRHILEKNQHLEDNTTIDTRAFYLTSSYKGRLGNQMFEYATLFTLSRRYPDRIAFIQSDEAFPSLRSVFGKSLTIQPRDVDNTSYTFVSSDVDENVTKKMNTLRNLPQADIMLRGYFQSYRYFSEYIDELRKEFTFSDEIQEQVANYYKNVTPIVWKGQSFVRVGVHVRRTDMMGMIVKGMGSISPPASYYSHAMDYFKHKYERVQFIVASDDLSWCREYIVGENVQYSGHNYDVDFAILSLSDHIIISLGTYSWWAGWLCEGTTVYYSAKAQNDSDWSWSRRLGASVGYLEVPDDKYNHWVPVI